MFFSRGFRAKDFMPYSPFKINFYTWFEIKVEVFSFPIWIYPVILECLLKRLAFLSLNSLGIFVGKSIHCISTSLFLNFLLDSTDLFFLNIIIYYLDCYSFTAKAQIRQPKSSDLIHLFQNFGVL